MKLEHGDEVSLRWLRGAGGVYDARRDELRHALGLTQAEVRAGCVDPRRCYLDVAGMARRDPALEAVDVRDELRHATRRLSWRERDALVSWARGESQRVTGLRWGVTKSIVSQVLATAFRKARSQDPSSGSSLHNPR